MVWKAATALCTVQKSQKTCQLFSKSLPYTRHKDNRNLPPSSTIKFVLADVLANSFTAATYLGYLNDFTVFIRLDSLSANLPTFPSSHHPFRLDSLIHPVKSELDKSNTVSISFAHQHHPNNVRSRLSSWTFR
jgi:hypothetical protein